MLLENTISKLLENGTIEEFEEIEVRLQRMKELKEKEKFAIEYFGKEPQQELKKKGDKLQEQYRYTKRINGKQVSITSKTKEIVYEKVWDYFHDGKTLLNKNVTLREVFFEYFEERQQDKSKSSETFRNELLDWNRFLEHHKLANMPIEKISVRDLRDFFGEITQRGLLKKKAARKPLTLLNAIFDFAVPNYCEHNIAREVNLNKYHFNMEEKTTIISYEEEDILSNYLESLPQTIYTLAIRLSYCFFLRVGELRALTWDDYDEKEGKIKIWHQMVTQKVDGKRTTLDVPYTKGNRASGVRDVPVSNKAKEILDELRKINGDKHYIFQGNRGAKFSINTNHFNEVLKKYCEECGVTYRSSHKARFLGISKLYEVGVDEAMIQKLAGHSSIEMTRHYNKDRRSTHIDKDKWDELFG